MSLPERAGIWALLLSLGGISYFSRRGALGVAQVRDSTLSPWSPVELFMDCGFVGESFEALQSAARPGLGGARTWPSYSQENIDLEQVQVQTAAPVEGRVQGVVVAGFSGLAPPRLAVTLRVQPVSGASVSLGDWPVRLTAVALLKPAYWKPHLETAAREAASLEGAAARAQGERARRRMAGLEEKMSFMGRPLAIEGRGTLAVRSTSRFLGLGARGLSALLALVALISGGVAFVIAWTYAKLLIWKEGDIEP